MSHRVLAHRALVALTISILSVSHGLAAEKIDRHSATDYAIAVCLTLQQSDFLREQGFGLGSIVVERTGKPVGFFEPVLQAVNAESADHPLTIIRGDGPVGETQSMPIAHCLDLTEMPRIKAAISMISKNGTETPAR